MVELRGIPTLTTERLTLRAPDARDWSPYRVLMTSERSRHMGGPHSAARAYKEFSVELAHWMIHGIGPWAVCLKGDDTALGYVGPYFPEGWPEREIGWMMFDGAEGKGYAAEAARAARRYAYEVAGWETAVSYIDPGNARSIALAERLGATLDPCATPLGDGDLVYRHPEQEHA